jgi:hypothetical protein
MEQGMPILPREYARSLDEGEDILGLHGFATGLQTEAVRQRLCVRRAADVLRWL